MDYAPELGERDQLSRRVVSGDLPVDNSVTNVGAGVDSGQFPA